MCGHYTKRARILSSKMAATCLIALLLLCAATAGAEDHVLCNAFTRITILSSKVFRAEVILNTTIDIVAHEICVTYSIVQRVCLRTETPFHSSIDHGHKL